MFKPGQMLQGFIISIPKYICYKDRRRTDWVDELSYHQHAENFKQKPKRKVERSSTQISLHI